MEDPFVQAVTTHLRQTPWGKCKACWHLETMPTERATALSDLLLSSTGHKKIAQICQDNGIDLGETSIARHRNGGHST